MLGPLVTDVHKMKINAAIYQHLFHLQLLARNQQRMNARSLGLLATLIFYFYFFAFPEQTHKYNSNYFNGIQYN